LIGGDAVVVTMDGPQVPVLPRNAVLAVSGAAMHEALATGTASFIRAALRAQAVVCYRCSPAQKAEAVRAVAAVTEQSVLAVGDGANDIEMIHAATVGVGLASREGGLAAAAGDFGLGAFADLRRLLFVHGRQAQFRVGRAVCFFLYKAFAMNMTAIALQGAALFSGTALVDSMMLAGHNLVYTAGAFLALTVLDSPAGSDDASIDRPETYAAAADDFTPQAVVASALYGALHAFVVVAVCGAAAVVDGGVMPLSLLSHTCYAALLLAIVVRAALMTSRWRPAIALALLACPVLWLFEIFVADTVVKTATCSLLLSAPRVLHLLFRPGTALLIVAAASAALLIDLVSAPTVSVRSPRASTI
jgi:magnesium-transporting ATPase (P-type)